MSGKNIDGEVFQTTIWQNICFWVCRYGVNSLCACDTRFRFRVKLYNNVRDCHWKNMRDWAWILGFLKCNEDDIKVKHLIQILNSYATKYSSLMPTFSQCRHRVVKKSLNLRSEPKARWNCFIFCCITYLPHNLGFTSVRKSPVKFQ